MINNEHQLPDGISQLKNAVEAKRPILGQVLDSMGHLAMQQYVEGFGYLPEVDPIQDPGDLIEVVRDTTCNLLGEETAQKVADRLTQSRHILTANHHGPDFLNITVQGNIITALGEDPQSAMPVLSFGDIPLNNITYGRGVMLPSAEGGDPLKVNIFPSKSSTELVSAAQAFTGPMVEAAVGQVNSLLDEGKVRVEDATALVKILEEIYLDPHVLAQPDYSSQSVIINHRLWQRMFDHETGEQMPEIVFLEIEKVTAKLLASDLVNEQSLIYQLQFNDNLLGAVLNGLDSKYGCWDTAKLEALGDMNRKYTLDELATMNAQLHLGYEDQDIVKLFAIFDDNYEGTDSKELKANFRRRLMAGAGTMFYWGVDEKNRRFPLRLEQEEENRFLVGVDDSGNERRTPFTPENVTGALLGNDLAPNIPFRLLPSLFTTFSAVSFARDYKAYGGFMQTDYLTAMKEGLVTALGSVFQEQSSDKFDWASKISKVPTDNYSTGMQVIVIKQQNGSIEPAGALPLISKGGLTTNDLDKIRGLNVVEANLLGLPGMYPTIYRIHEQTEDLLAVDAAEIFNFIGDNLVVIDRSGH